MGRRAFMDLFFWFGTPNPDAMFEELDTKGKR